MELCMVFIDAVRGNLSSFKYKNNTETKLEKFIKKNGGTYFNNAYTIAPDTLRASGSIISGLYPKKNGNFQIGGATNIFFDKNLINIFQYLLNKNFEIFLVVQPVFIAYEIFGTSENLKYYYDYRDAQADYEKSEAKNKLIFYYIFEYHELTGSICTLQEEKKARNKIGDMLNNILKNIQNFDKVLLFSDHGLTLYEDKEKNYYSLKEHKTSIILWLKEKEDINLKIEDKLVSILDIFPTIISWFEDEKKYKLDGYSLYSDVERILIMEDGHSNYNGFFLEENDLIQNYSIGIKTKEWFEIYKINDLEKLENLELWKEIRAKTKYAELFNNIYKNKKLRNNWRKDKKVCVVNDKYNIFDKNYKQLYYLDFSEKFNLKTSPIFRIKNKLKYYLIRILLKLKKIVEKI